MKKNGILNSEISWVLSYMGHTDCIVIGDCGLPIPNETERIDLALAFGIPTFMQTLEIVAKDMKIEKNNPCRRNKGKNPDILREIENLFSIAILKQNLSAMVSLKKRQKTAKLLSEQEKLLHMQILFCSQAVFFHSKGDEI